MSFAWTRLFRAESFRLAAIVAAVITGAMLILMAAVFAIAHHALREQLFAGIERDIAAIQEGMITEGVSEAEEEINQRLYRAGTSDFLLLETVGGKKLAGNLAPMPPHSGRRSLPDRRAGGGGDDHLIRGEGVLLNPGLFLFVGRDVAPMREAEENLLNTFLWVLAATLILAAAGGLTVSSVFLARMDAITTTCRAIMAGHLSDRIPERGTRDEFGRLVHTINAMLDRIHALMENVQQISSDIAHDMRAPLTRLRQRLEMARANAMSADAFKAAIDEALDETETILSTFTALLRIGQLEAQAELRDLDRIDLSALADEMAGLYRAVAEDRDHALICTIAPGLAVRGDRALLAQALANLIENALTHTPPGTAVALNIAPQSEEVIVAVEDHGPGIPEEERERVFRRFYRLERSRTSPGTGLGLPLVGAIMRYHGGRIVLADNAPGLTVILTFKRA